MKQLFPLIMALLLACFLPAWAASPQEKRKSYEDMTPAEIKAEVELLENKLMKAARRSSGVPLNNNPVNAKPEKQASLAGEKDDRPIKQKSGVVEKQADMDHGQKLLHDRHRQWVEKMAQESQPENRGGTDSMRTVIKNESAKIEQERQRFEHKEPDVVRLKPAPEPEKAQREETDDNGMRVIELELPLYIGDRKNLTKKRVKIKAKPETIEIHRQILDLDRMLIDDVVRMTGKPLQKNTGQKVRCF